MLTISIVINAVDAHIIVKQTMKAYQFKTKKQINKQPTGQTIAEKDGEIERSRRGG